MISFIMLLARRGSRIYEVVGIDTSGQKTAEVDLADGVIHISRRCTIHPSHWLCCSNTRKPLAHLWNIDMHQNNLIPSIQMKKIARGLSPYFVSTVPPFWTADSLLQWFMGGAYFCKWFLNELSSSLSPGRCQVSLLTEMYKISMGVFYISVFNLKP